MDAATCETTVSPTQDTPAKKPKPERLRALAAAALLEKLGLGYFSPIIRLLAGHDIKVNGSRSSQIPCFRRW
jgi:hypothetical protein